MWAFQRRGLAMDNCRLLDWEVHETWVQFMLNAMTRDCPTGFHSVKTEQLIKADRELWTILAQENLESLKPINDVPVLNKFFKALVTDPRITMYLLPVPSATSKAGCSSCTKADSAAQASRSSSSRYQQETQVDQSSERVPTGTQRL